MRRAIAWGAVPLVLFGALSACGDEPVATLDHELPFPEAEGITFEGEYVFTTAEGIRTSHLTFDTLYSFGDSVGSELRGLTLTIWNADGSERAQVTAREGTADPRFESLTARREVVATIPSEGRRLETEHLLYDPSQDRISSDACFVMYVEGEEPQRGTSFTSDLEFRNFTILGNRPEDLARCPP